jgi:hypothetical protein
VTGEVEVTEDRNDYLTVAYRPEGDTLWTMQYDGPAHSWDRPFAIGVDHFGDVYVTGA